MAIKKYSKAKDGAKKLSANFTVREFACKDGSDSLLIDDELVAILQKLRNWAGAPVIINSAYRNASYNKKIGGATNSRHVAGQAADIRATGKTPKELAKFAQAIGARGVGCYTGVQGNFVHVDTRPGKYYWVNTTGKDVSCGGHGGVCSYSKPSANLRKGSSGNGVRWLQWWLNLWGYGLSVDGMFGTATQTAVRSLQKKRGLVVDAIVGVKTRAALTGE